MAVKWEISPFFGTDPVDPSLKVSATGAGRESSYFWTLETEAQERSPCCGMVMAVYTGIASAVTLRHVFCEILKKKLRGPRADCRGQTNGRERDEKGM